MSFDDGRFPKDRSFPRSQPGRAALDQIGANDSLTWLRKRRMQPDGVMAEARNKGGYLTVKANPPLGLDGYLAVGLMVSPAEYHVLGDDDARGAFKDRGPFVASTGFTFGQSAIYSRFDGFGQLDAAERLGYVTNKQGIGCPQFLITEYKTYTGKKVDPLYSYYFTRPTFDIGAESVNGLTTVPAARYRVGSAAQKIGVCMGGVVMDDTGEFTPYLILDRYGDDLTLTFPPCVPDQYPWQYSVHRLNPTTLVSRTTYMRSQYPVNYLGAPIPNRVDNAENPGLEWRFSYDNGLTWVDAASDDLFQEFYDTVLPLPGIDISSGSQDTDNNALFNEAVDDIIMQVAPISASRALVYCLVPYLDGALKKNKVKVGMIDATARTITEVQVLGDGDRDDTWYSMGTQTLESVPGGAIISRMPIVDTVRPWRNHIQYGFTADGSSIAWGPDVPWQAWNTGFLLPVSEKECVVPIYDAARGYVLMGTKDNGVTFYERATMTDNGVAPNEINQQPFSTNFAGVSHIRDAGVAANPLPGAPWICDSSKPTPSP